jgi:hypothetical protein
MANRSPSEKSDIERMSASEKNAVIHTEVIHNGILTVEEADFLANFSDEKRKKVLRKVDWRLMPVLLLLYLATYLDKTNIGNAAIEGLTTDLKLTGIQYQIAVSLLSFVVELNKSLSTLKCCY